MIRACINALARLSRQEQISSDDVSAMGAPSECLSAVLSTLTKQAVAVLHADGIRTQRQLNEALREATNEELEALLKRVDEEMPNPFEWQPPTEPFCSHCDKRPSWWAGSTKAEREAKGYLVDFENQETELRYRGQTVCCDECQAACDEQMDEFERAMGVVDHGPNPYADDAEYTRYCLEMSITRCLGNDWAVPE